MMTIQQNLFCINIQTNYQHTHRRKVAGSVITSKLQIFPRETLIQVIHMLVDTMDPEMHQLHPEMKSRYPKPFSFLVHQNLKRCRNL